MWITLFAFYFFSLPAALVHMGLIGAGYAVALAAESPPGDPLDGWLATLGTLLAIDRAREELDWRPQHSWREVIGADSQPS